MQRPLEIRFRQMDPSPAIEASIDRTGGFGFIETPEGEVYFHRNSVVEGAFEDLEPGREVRLEVAERESEEGWQATAVRPVGKHHLQDRPS